MAVIETSVEASAPVKDLRDWLQRVEAMGELVRVQEEVDWDQEMAAITYLVGKQEGGPAVLFENIKGYGQEYRSLWNILASSFNRVALTLGEPPGTPALELIRRARTTLNRRIPPVEVDPASAPINENVLLGGDVDITRFPAPKHWPLDGGRYIGTADAVITRDPDTGVINIGTYRMMVHDRNHVGLYLSPGKDARLHITRAWQRNEPLEVAACWGVDPVYLMIGSQTYPKNLSEYEFVGGVKGRPAEVVRGSVTNLLLPAHAEVAIEGIIYPNATRLEGPFGEFTGYYGRPEANAPVIEVKAVHFRNRPIFTNALMADYPSCEQSVFFSVARSARIWNDLEMLGIPGIKGVYAHPAAAGGFGMQVISLEQRYPGHAAQALALAAQCPGGAYYGKWIIAVDDDVDPTDTNQVIWAMATRCNPIEDIDILRNTWSTWLDPTQNPPEERPYGSKALINACKEHRYLPVFSKRSRLTREMYEQVVARWQQLGLPGQPPALLSFEEEERVPYHEAEELHLRRVLPESGAPHGAPSM